MAKSPFQARSAALTPHHVNEEVLMSNLIAVVCEDEREALAL